MWRGRRVIETVPRSLPAPQHVELDQKVADVLNWFPETSPVFERYGFEPLRHPMLRRTLARQVTLRQAAKFRGVPAEALLFDLNQAIVHTAPAHQRSVHLTVLSNGE
jgi:hypothetical protein